jgi:hypothetical protein
VVGTKGHPHPRLVLFPVAVAAALAVLFRFRFPVLFRVSFRSRVSFPLREMRPELRKERGVRRRRTGLSGR